MSSSFILRNWNQTHRFQRRSDLMGWRFVSGAWWWWSGGGRGSGRSSGRQAGPALGQQDGRAGGPDRFRWETPVVWTLYVEMRVSGWQKGLLGSFSVVGCNSFLKASWPPLRSGDISLVHSHYCLSSCLWFICDGNSSGRSGVISAGSRVRCDGQRWTTSVQSGRKRAERGDLQVLLSQRNGQENVFGDPGSNQSVHSFIFL